MSRKHYAATARMLRGLTICDGRGHTPLNAEPRITLMDVVRGLADIFESDNERFDRDKFFDAVYHHGASRPDSGREGKVDS